MFERVFVTTCSEKSVGIIIIACRLLVKNNFGVDISNAIFTIRGEKSRNIIIV